MIFKEYFSLIYEATVTRIEVPTSIQSLGKVIGGPLEPEVSISIVISVISGFTNRKAKRELNLSGVYTFIQRFNGRPVYKVGEKQ